MQAFSKSYLRAHINKAGGTPPDSSRPDSVISKCRILPVDWRCVHAPGSILAVLLGNVIRHLDILGVHPAQDIVDHLHDVLHNPVDYPRVFR